MKYFPLLIVALVSFSACAPSKKGNPIALPAQPVTQPAAPAEDSKQSQKTDQTREDGPQNQAAASPSSNQAATPTAQPPAAPNGAAATPPPSNGSESVTPPPAVTTPNVSTGSGTPATPPAAKPANQPVNPQPATTKPVDTKPGSAAKPAAQKTDLGELLLGNLIQFQLQIGRNLTTQEKIDSLFISQPTPKETPVLALVGEVKSVEKPKVEIILPSELSKKVASKKYLTYITCAFRTAVSRGQTIAPRPNDGVDMKVLISTQQETSKDPTLARKFRAKSIDSRITMGCWTNLVDGTNNQPIDLKKIKVSQINSLLEDFITVLPQTTQGAK